MTDYHSFHPACLDDARLPQKPGDVVVSLSTPLFLQGPEPDHALMLEPGVLLHVASAVPSIRAAAYDHVVGTVGTSDLRFAVAQMLGLFEPGAARLKSIGENQVDDWIADNTVISIREHGDGHEVETRTGWFDNARARWAGAHDGEAT